MNFRTMTLNRTLTLYRLLIIACAAALLSLISCTRISSLTPTRNGNGASIPHANLLSVATPASLPSQIKQYEGFILSFNRDNHTPNWVAWELLDSETDGPHSRSNKFWQDPDIEGCPSTDDYRRSGYDRGHMSPAADNKLSARMMHDSFVMANICPQAHALNAGAWKTLEEKERQWARSDSAIIIIAGPIYSQTDTERIGDAGVRVPSAFFKVIAAPYASQPRGIAFIYPNMQAPGNMADYVVTIDEVESITGLDFFHTLPQSAQQQLESKSNFRLWR